MGWDIHLFVERCDGEEWFHVATFSSPRDYIVFGALAGVREHDIPHIEPRGLPEDTDFIIRDAANSDGPNGFAHSWLYAQEFALALETVEHCDPVVAVERSIWQGIGSLVTTIANGDAFSCRVVFWFDA